MTSGVQAQAALLKNSWLSYTSTVQAEGKLATMSSYPGVEQLCAAGHAELVGVHFLEELRVELRQRHLSVFWDTLQRTKADVVEQLGPILLQALQTLVFEVEAQREQLGALCSTLVSSPTSNATRNGMLLRHEQLLTALLMVTAPLSLSDMLRAYYDSKLDSFSQTVQARLKAEKAGSGAEEDDSDDDEDEGMGLVDFNGEFAAADVMGGEWVAEVTAIAAALRGLGMGALSESIFSGVVYGHVQRQLSASAKGTFQKHCLAGARRYVHSVPLEFVSLLCGWSALSGGEAPERREWESRLDYYVYNTIAELRIGEMFEIVVDYPESTPAVEDLRECLCNTNNQQAFILSFTASIQERLLRAGAATTDIIRQYVSTIKALRDLDPAGVLLEAVGQPIKEYLKCRKDTIRCIVTMLTDDSEGGEGGMETLYTELKRGEVGDGSDGEEGETDEAVFSAMTDWEPDPVEADPGRSPGSRRTHDVISMLIGIYGSKELFINEYRAMLADKLLAKVDFDTQREIRTLELLKLRFGDANLHSCEVMLKDIADSKRINTNVRKIPRDTPLAGEMREQPPADLDTFGATILSTLFWPPFKDQQMNLPASVQRMADTFADRYHRLKAPRKLQFGLQFGTAELEVQVGEKTLEFTVSALHAAILLQFQERHEWGAAELAEAVGLPVGALRRKALFWVNAGVLLEGRCAADKPFYSAATQYSEAATAGGGGGPSAAEEEGGLSAAEEQSAADMAVHESFVIGMLTNHEELPLAMIHNMLKMFVSGFDKSAEQVAAFLARLVREEKLMFEGGAYKKRP